MQSSSGHYPGGVINSLISWEGLMTKVTQTDLPKPAASWKITLRLISDTQLIQKCNASPGGSKSHNHMNCCIHHNNNIFGWLQPQELGRYHAWGIHKWNDGEYSFHPAQVCSCGSCSDEEELKCPDKGYESRSVVICPMHSLAYDIECDHRANDAADSTLI